MLSLLGPYKWIAETLAVGLVALAICLAIHHYGEGRYTDGVVWQTAQDQKQFDRVNEQLTEQKSQANKIISDAQLSIIALQQQREAMLAQWEKRNAQDHDATDAARRDLASRSLRITIPVTQNSGCGRSGTGALPGPAESASAARTETVELPAQVGSDLRQLVLDADTDADWYRACYRSWYPGWQEPQQVSRR